MEVSFSSRIKQELETVFAQERHCNIAELAGIIGFYGNIIISEVNKYELKIRSENLSVVRKCFTLVKKTFNMDTDIVISKKNYNKNLIYEVHISSHSYTCEILKAIQFMKHVGDEVEEELSITRNEIIQLECCRKAYIRGVFLAAGSMCNPNKAYHLEIVCTTDAKANQLKLIINSFKMDAKIVKRKKNYIVYLKDSKQIVEVLNIMGAQNALLEMKNVRVIKNVRNSVNRQVNCETANINKTVSASVKQVKDILYIKETVGIEKLPLALQEIAEVRLIYPEITLKELGEALSVPIGKSGVNHRLRKLSMMAEKLRENQEGHYD